MLNSSNSCTILLTREPLPVSIRFTIEWLTNNEFAYLHFPDTNQLSTYTKMHEPIHNELVKLLRSVPEQLHSMNESNLNASTQQSTAIKGELKTQQAQILRTIRDNIKTEVHKYPIECVHDPYD